MKLDEYLLLFMHKVPTVQPNTIKFWAMTGILINAGIKIELYGIEMTARDCFREMDDLANGIVWTRQQSDMFFWLKQKQKYFGW